MLSALDVTLIGAFVAYCIVSGLRARSKASESLEEYFLAGRTLSGEKAGLSMAATQFAADTPLLVTGMIAIGGIFSLWRLWIYAIAFLAMGVFFAPLWRRARVLTDAELSELRYGGRGALTLRVLKAVYFGVIFNCTVLAMVLLAATRIAEPFLVWDQWLSPDLFAKVVGFVQHAGLDLASSGSAVQGANNLLSLVAISLLTLLYSTAGGLRAVVDTDLVQLALALVGTLLYAIVLVHAAGGLFHLPARLTELYGATWTGQTLAFSSPSRARDTSWLVLGTIGIQWLAQMNSDGTGYLAQRTMACRSDRDARRAAIVFVVAQVLVRSLLWIPIGLALLVLAPTGGAPPDASLTAAREATYVDGIVQYLPSGARGLLLVGMLAALASTLDTHLNWGASYVTNDIYKRLVCQAWLKRSPNERSLVWIARSSNVLVLCLAAIVLGRIDSIQTGWHATLLLGAGMGIPLVLRWFWWRMTALSEIASIILSSVLAPVLLIFVHDEGARMLSITVASSLTAIVVAALNRSPETARAFYRKVRPPGFWAPVAEHEGDDPRMGRRRLWNGIVTSGALSLVVFCVLVLIGTLLFQSPAPRWLPSRVAWLATLATATVGLLYWLRRRRVLE